jgi:hypothetical protein
MHSDIPVRQSDEGEEAFAELLGGDFTIANFFPFSAFLRFSIWWGESWQGHG